MKHNLTKYVVLLIAVLSGFAVLTPSAWAALTLKANHDDIQINLGYHGSTVSVAGISDPSVDLIMKITPASGNAQEKMMRKEREAGILWMNVEQLTLDNVPELYLIKSTKPVADLLDPATLKTEGIGYDAVQSSLRITPTPSPEQREKLLGDFIKYKQSLNVYSQSVGDVEMEPDPAGESYYTVFDWPYQAPPDDYMVTVYAVKDGKIQDKAESPVKVEETGTIKALDDMARNNAALYGTAAIGVALTAGFGVGLVFKGGGSH
ncbi:MAG: TIGR02186 family protein [Actinobacteria bacterium]|nr:TIGR02186 family protein [Actinomycetota bacterium]